MYFVLVKYHESDTWIWSRSFSMPKQTSIKLEILQATPTDNLSGAIITVSQWGYDAFHQDYQTCTLSLHKSCFINWNRLFSVYRTIYLFYYFTVALTQHINLRSILQVSCEPFPHWVAVMGSTVSLLFWIKPKQLINEGFNEHKDNTSLIFPKGKDNHCSLPFKE